MITKRIIPCLDVRNGRVVKGTNFEGIRDVADPVEMARLYNAAGADELVFYDITASYEGRALFTDILTQVRPGLHLGTLKKNRFEPSHALALALRPDQVDRKSTRLNSSHT